MVTVTEEILNEKLHFLCGANYLYYIIELVAYELSELTRGYLKLCCYCCLVLDVFCMDPLVAKCQAGPCQMGNVWQDFLLEIHHLLLMFKLQKI